MKINLILKNLIILVSIVVLLNFSFFSTSASNDEDFKDKYGVHLVFGN